MQHHAQNAVDAEPGMPEAGVVHGLKTRSQKDLPLPMRSAIPYASLSAIPMDKPTRIGNVILPSDQSSAVGFAGGDCTRPSPYLEHMERLRQQSVDLCSSCKQTIRRNQELRARHRLVLQEQQTATLGWIIRGKLRLPRVWPLILSADPSAGGMCDACDKPLLPTQMVMTFRGRDPFVRLHADCFLLWNDIRSETAEAPERVTGRRPLRV
jgi:hypothetical protein